MWESKWCSLHFTNFLFRPVPSHMFFHTLKMKQNLILLFMKFNIMQLYLLLSLWWTTFKWIPYPKNACVLRYWEISLISHSKFRKNANFSDFRTLFCEKCDLWDSALKPSAYTEEHCSAAVQEKLRNICQNNHWGIRKYTTIFYAPKPPAATSSRPRVLCVHSHISQ